MDKGIYEGMFIEKEVTLNTQCNLFYVLLKDQFKELFSVIIQLLSIKFTNEVEVFFYFTLGIVYIYIK